MKKFAAVLALGLFAMGCAQETPPPAPSAPLSHGAPSAAHEMTNDPAAAAPAADPAAPAAADPAAAPAADPAAPAAADAPAAPANP